MTEGNKIIIINIHTLSTGSVKQILYAFSLLYPSTYDANAAFGCVYVRYPNVYQCHLIN